MIKKCVLFELLFSMCSNICAWREFLFHVEVGHFLYLPHTILASILVFQLKMRPFVFKPASYIRLKFYIFLLSNITCTTLCNQLIVKTSEKRTDFRAMLPVGVFFLAMIYISSKYYFKACAEIQKIA